MAYNPGTSTNIIVGAAALFTYEGGELTNGLLPAYVANTSYKSTLSGYDSGDADTVADFRNVGYTMNGLELQFQPDFGEVQVDQILDSAKLYKQGMKVNLNTAFAEATLENLLFALAGKTGDLATITGTGLATGSKSLNLSAGEIGECPVERGLVAVGPGTGDCDPALAIERIYVAYRALSIESVNASAKRDEATMFEVSFRLLPNDSSSYGKIVDRVIPAA
jgi:hypothetical protein